MFEMFEFEHREEVLKLLASWAMLCVALPIYWWLVQGELVALQLVRSAEGWLYFGACFVLALVIRPMVNQIAGSR